MSQNRTRKVYKAVSITDLALSKLRSDVDARQLVSKMPCLTDMVVPIVETSFGQVRPPDFDYNEFPAGEWLRKDYAFEDGFVYHISNAVVHGESGIITVDDLLIRESLYLAFPEAWSMRWEDEDHLSIPAAGSELHVHSAAHALCGAGGNRNYGHWWSNIVPALLVPPFGSTFADTIILMPKVRAKWQSATLKLMPEMDGKAIFLDENILVNCASLKFVPRITWSDYYPHPSRMSMIAHLRSRVGATRRPDRRIYVSRSDSQIRKLVNESEIEGLANDAGFDIVVLSGKDVSEQIRIFAGATHVIGPHGAGLANVIFCDPDTVLCELHKNTTVQWSIRRTASAARLRYGCLIGQDLHDPAYQSNIHDGPWRLDPDLFSSMLQREPFI